MGPASRLLTRYGDVTPLLRTVEDHYVVFGAGEEISLEFDATALPPRPMAGRVTICSMPSDI